MTDAKNAPVVVAIHQPNFLPWCGYFAKARAADIFVFLDDVQMPQGRSYVSRTQIGINGAPQWLSVPVRKKSGAMINDIEIVQDNWPKKFERTFRLNYGQSPHYGEVIERLGPILSAPQARLADYNQRLIEAIFGYLGWTKKIVRSSSLAIKAASDDRLIEIVKAVGGTCYLSGKGGTNYQDPEKFAAAGIALRVCEYMPVAYARRGGPFIPGLSAVDALFHLGREAESVMRYPHGECGG